MIAAIRKFAKSWLAVVLFGLVIISFVVAGIGTNLLQGPVSSFVVKAGSRTVTPADFKRDFEKYRASLEQRFQQPISNELAVAQNVDRRMLEELALRESFHEMLARIGLRASDKMFNEQLRQETAFFNPVSGEFDPERYKSRLAEASLTPASYKAILSDEMRRSQFIAAATSGFSAPRAYTAMFAVLGLEQRDLAHFVIDPRSIGTIPPPTDAEIQAFVKQNAAQYTLPEFRGLTVVRFSRKALESGVTVDPAEVRKQFDFQKDSLSTPERRTALQIPVKDAAQAQAVIAGVKGGKSPNVVAGAMGIQPVRYDDKPRSAFFDKAVGDAAFATPAGGISGPVSGQFGLVVVAVLQVTPGQQASFEAHRAEIEAKVRADLAGQKVSAMADAYEDAHGAGASLTEAAAKAGAVSVVYGPVTADGRGSDAAPVAGLSPEILKTAFELPQGAESDIEEAGEGEFYAVQVDRIVPPAVPPMAVIKAAVVRRLMMTRAVERMQARADALAARVRKGESIEAVAASAGATLVRTPALSRATQQQHESLGRELLGGAFAAKKGEVFVAPGSAGIAVAMVAAVRPGDAAQVAQVTEGQRGQLAQDLFGDIGAAAQTYARTRLKTVTNPARARAALGVDTTQADGEGDGAATPADKGQ